MKVSRDLLSIDLLEFLNNQPGAVEEKAHSSKRYPYFNVNGTKIFLYKSSNFNHFNIFQTVNEVPLTVKFSPGKPHQGNIGELALLLTSNNIDAADKLLRNYANIPIFDNQITKSLNQTDNLYTPKAISNINHYFQNHLLDAKYAEHYLKNRFISSGTINKYKRNIFSIAVFSKSKMGEKYFPLAFPIYTQQNEIIAIQKILPDKKINFQKSSDENFNAHIESHGFLLLDGIWKSIIDEKLPFVLSESPIDALSYAQMNNNANYNLIGTMGSLNEQKLLHIQNIIKNNPTVLAFDNDPAGIIASFKVIMAQNGIPSTDFNIRFDKKTDNFILTNETTKEIFNLTKDQFVDFIQHSKPPHFKLDLPILKDFNDDLKAISLQKQELNTPISNHSKFKSIVLCLISLIYHLP